MEVLFVGIIMLFCIHIFYNFTIDGRQGLLHIAGGTESPDKSSTLISENGSRLDEIIETEAPEIKYTGRVCKVGETVMLKTLFGVKLPGDSDYRLGESENGFRLYVEDITDEQGNTYLVDADMELEDSSDEIIAALSYNRDTGEICFHQSGVYRVVIKAYGTNGRITKKEVTIPVESI